MRTLMIALLMTLATQAKAGCGNFCSAHWWVSVETADLRARDKDDKTPLHWAATHGTPENN